MFYLEKEDHQRAPASVSADFEVSNHKATLSVAPQEFPGSMPTEGRSFFDKVFSEKGQYKVPYPFTLVLQRLSEYTGQKINSPDSSGLKVAMIPMGRSLQRNAAVEGVANPSIENFFRYPRIVVAVDEEPTHENALVLNLKNKMYLGFNEKAQVIEVISYNEENGRYEYQVVRDYAEGKSSQVVYANRSLCLSCHQNQTPIFSKGPWSETNANPVIAEKLQSVFDQAFGKAACASSKPQTYCYQDNKPFYLGAPVQIESHVTHQFDTSTDLANLTHAYQKMWKELCVSDSCRTQFLQSMILYRLSAQEGLVPTAEMKNQIDKMEQAWKLRYSWGWAVPSPDIPDRDPLKDVQKDPQISDLSTVSDLNRQEVLQLLSSSKIPSAFEPLLPRAPTAIWKDTGIDSSNTNRLIRGLAQEFTLSDLKWLDQWLKANRNEKDLVTQLTSVCDIQKDKWNLVISCKGESEESFAFDTYITFSGNQGQAKISELNYRSKKLNCDSQLGPTEDTVACTRFSDLAGHFVKSSEAQGSLTLKLKNGLGVKTLNGYDMSEVQFDLEAKVANIKVYSPLSFLQSVIEQNTRSLFANEIFNRFQIMKTLMSLQATKLTRQQDESYQGLPLTVDASFTAEELQEKMNGFALMKNVCIQCHQKNDNTPPHFMGTVTHPLNDFEMCQQIEQCAPRMIYRLKMRQCSIADAKSKKNAMPPANFFKDEASLSYWMNIYNPKIIKFLFSLVDEKNLTQAFVGAGLPDSQAQKATTDILSSDCPESDSIVYDQLPKCEFNKLKPYTTKTRCR